MFSVCVEEHLTDCGFVVIHVFGEPLLGEPLLGQGLLIELDVTLCEKVVLGLITCERDVLVIRPHAQVYLLLNLKEDEGQEEMLEDKDEERRKVKLMKRSRKSERTLNSCMRHGDDHGVE